MANFKHISIDETSYDAIPAGSYVTGVKGSAESTYRTGNVNLSKTNVGLGNVPNVTTNNQTPTFSQASTRNNLVSGEKLSVLFGKIMKWFADLKTVAFSGSYNDLSDKPTIPTVNNATLTIQKNGTNVQTFSANQGTNVTANITVPTINNTHTSTSTTQALSANQGKVIWDYIQNLSGTKTFVNAGSDFISGYCFNNDHISAGIVFSNWNNNTDFPELYGSGILLPCTDPSERVLVYVCTSLNAYIGRYKKNNNGTITKTWRKITTTA